MFSSKHGDISEAGICIIYIYIRERKSYAMQDVVHRVHEMPRVILVKQRSQWDTKMQFYAVRFGLHGTTNDPTRAR